MSIDRAELLFTGLITPERRAGDEGAGVQADVALARLKETLAGRGLGLDDLLRLRLFVGNLGERAVIEEALQGRLGSERPAVSVIELPAGSLPSAVSVSLDAVAAPGARERRRLVPGGVRLGPWVFLGALAAGDPRALFARMEELLRAQDAALRDVVKVGGWLTFPMRAYGPLGEARSALVGEAGLLPASAAVQVGRVGLGGERLAFEAIAHTSRAAPASARHPTSRLADFYLDARVAGDYVFTSGEVPDGRGALAAQAREIYERLRAHLAKHGATPADVVQQTVFVRAAGEHAAGKRDRSDTLIDGAKVTEAARAFYGSAALPPTTVLPVADFGFRAGCAVEIELVARIGG